MASSMSETSVSCDSSLSFLSSSISTLILFTSSLSISKMVLSVSSLFFFWIERNSWSFLNSSTAFLRVIESHYSLSIVSDLTISYSLGRSDSRVEFRENNISERILVSVETSARRKLTLSSRYLIYLDSESLLLTISCSNFCVSLESREDISLLRVSVWSSKLRAFSSTIRYRRSTSSLRPAIFLLYSSIEQLNLSSI